MLAGRAVARVRPLGKARYAAPWLLDGQVGAEEANHVALQWFSDPNVHFHPPRAGLRSVGKSFQSDFTVPHPVKEKTCIRSWPFSIPERCFACCRGIDFMRASSAASLRP